MIINSLLDTDLYKFTMMQAVYHQLTGKSHDCVFRFKLRNYTPDRLGSYGHEIQREVEHLTTLRFRTEELEYLAGLPFIKPDFVDFLRHFQLDIRHISIWTDDNGELQIEIKGPWLLTILFEVPVLAIVNEVYFRDHYPIDTTLWPLQDALERKIEYVKEAATSIRFADFGTRRRYSFLWHQRLVRKLKDTFPDDGFSIAHFVGTSNVLLAMENDLTPIGTMAHEWIQAFQAIVRVSDSQKAAFQVWADEYRGDLGIALSDTLGFDAFLKDFDPYFAKLFDGARHDSGDPYDWGERLIQHYDSMGIDALTKTAVFSDGLTFEKAIALNHKLSGRIRCSFGIGTYLTNDFSVSGEKVEPLQIVIKMTECMGRPVAKISDSPGKQMCEDAEYLKYLASQFDIPQVRKTKKAMLLGVDPLNDFFDDFEGAKLPVPGSSKIREAIKEATEGWKDGSTHHIVGDNHKPGDPEFDVYGEHCVGGTPGANRIDEVRGGGTGHHKQHVNMFHSGLGVLGINRLLADYDRVYVYGVATNICVRHAVLGLLERGKEVIVLEDAVKGLDVEGVPLTADAIIEMSVAGATFITVDGMLKRERV